MGCFQKRWSRRSLSNPHDFKRQFNWQQSYSQFTLNGQFNRQQSYSQFTLNGQFNWHQSYSQFTLNGQFNWQQSYSQFTLNGQFNWQQSYSQFTHFLRPTTISHLTVPLKLLILRPEPCLEIHPVSINWSHNYWNLKVCWENSSKLISTNKYLNTELLIVQTWAHEKE